MPAKAGIQQSSALDWLRRCFRGLPAGDPHPEPQRAGDAAAMPEPGAAHRGGVAFALLGMMVWVGLMTWIIAEAEYTAERAIRNVINEIYDEMPT